MERLVNAKVDSGRCAIVWLGHGGFALKPHSGDVIVVDPFLSPGDSGVNSRPRLQQPPIKPQNVKLDYLFLTHDHPDSADPDTLTHIVHKNPDATIVCPPSCCRLLSHLGVPNDNIQVLTAGQHMSFPNFVVHATPAYHTDDSLGYVFEFDQTDASPAEVCVYHTGHSAFDPGLACAVADFGPDVLLVPISGEDGNMDAESAATLTAHIAPSEVIPMSYGTFRGTDVDVDQFASLVADAKDREDQIATVPMQVGACHIFCPEASLHGRHGAKLARAERALKARKGHEHRDGVRGPNGGSGIARGAGRGH